MGDHSDRRGGADRRVPQRGPPLPGTRRRGDLLGFAVLGAVGVAANARVKHEAAICLALIGIVVLAGPQWPLALAEPAWWALFFIGLAIYIAIRRRICD